MEGEPPLSPPIAPMLGRLARRLRGDGVVYEPKWDGFRCLAFCGERGVDLRSRNDRALSRYFPELVDALTSSLDEPAVVDGEIFAVSGGAFDFAALLARLHPAQTRVERLSRETPARFIAFDLLARGDEDLRAKPFATRREALERLLADARPPLHLSPVTDDVETARDWLEHHQGAGIDGVIVKQREQPYEPGARTMTKVKLEQTADCVVAGCRLAVDAPVIGSLLLGLYDDEDLLRHVGVASSFTAKRRRELLEELAPHVTKLAGHPWAEGFLLAGSPMGRLKGAAGRWSAAEMELDWVPLAPLLVCEVAYDHIDVDRFRHPARFKRWRPDRDAASCRFDQFSVPAHDPLEVLGAA
jgi:ATP-dependent DNA ligase